MKNNRNPAITETLRISLGMLICLGLMIGVYLLIGQYTMHVLIGGIVGTVIAIGNFFFMAVGLSNLADDATEGRIRIRTQGSFMVRTFVMLALLFVAIKFGKCDALATALPLLFVRPVIMMEQFILKSKGKENDHES